METLLEAIAASAEDAIDPPKWAPWGNAHAHTHTHTRTHTRLQFIAEFTFLRRLYVRI